MNEANGEQFVLYGDPAYPVRRHLIAPFGGEQLSQAEQQFNRNMSAVRTSVEWGYGKIIQYFAFMDFSKNLKVLLQPVRKFYCVAALLVTILVCMVHLQGVSLAWRHHCWKVDCFCNERLLLKHIHRENNG